MTATVTAEQVRFRGATDAPVLARGDAHWVDIHMDTPGIESLYKATKTIISWLTPQGSDEYYSIQGTMFERLTILAMTMQGDVANKKFLLTSVKPHVAMTKISVLFMHFKMWRR